MTHCFGRFLYTSEQVLFVCVGPRFGRTNSTAIGLARADSTATGRARALKHVNHDVMFYSSCIRDLRDKKKDVTLTTGS